MPPKGKATTRVAPPHDSRKRQALNADQQPTKRTCRTRTTNADDNDNHEPKEEEGEEEYEQEEEEEPEAPPLRVAKRGPPVKKGPPQR